MCRTAGCQRQALRSSGGAAYAHCEAHTRAILRDAFREPEWVRRARAHALPAKVLTV